MGISFKTKNVCATEINFKVEENIVKEIKFIGGCPGSAVGVSALAEGMQVEEVIERLEGIQCRSRGTSCPDQLAQALKKQIQDVEKTKDTPLFSGLDPELLSESEIAKDAFYSVSH